VRYFSDDIASLLNFDASKETRGSYLFYKKCQIRDMGRMSDSEYVWY